MLVSFLQAVEIEEDEMGNSFVLLNLQSSCGYAR